MSTSLPFDPARTVVALWRIRLTGSKRHEKTHWLTKTMYYAAVRELLGENPGRRLTWHDVVAAVRPKGSRSTFYEVAGRHARKALIDSFRRDSLQLALCYQRTSPSAQLIDEAKVWSFWPYRQGWIEQCEQMPNLPVARAIDALHAVVAEWTRREVGLAMALDGSPPACAVEDLVLLNHGQLPALRALATLRLVMIDAARDDGEASDVDEDPDPATPTDRSSSDWLVVELAERIFALNVMARGLTSVDAVGLRHTARALMADAASLMADAAPGAGRT